MVNLDDNIMKIQVWEVLLIDFIFLKSIFSLEQFRNIYILMENSWMMSLKFSIYLVWRTR